MPDTCKECGTELGDSDFTCPSCGAAQVTQVDALPKGVRASADGGRPKRKHRHGHKDDSHPSRARWIRVDREGGRRLVKMRMSVPGLAFTVLLIASMIVASYALGALALR